MNHINKFCIGIFKSDITENAANGSSSSFHMLKISEITVKLFHFGRLTKYLLSITKRKKMIRNKLELFFQNGQFF